jgi:hypothetical protein
MRTHPITRNDTKNELYHQVFCFWCREIMGNEYTCWAAIQQFKLKPNKRCGIFIVDTWLKAAPASVGQTKDQSILDSINPGSIESRFKPAHRTALQQKSTDLKSVKTWKGKLANWSNRGTLGQVDAHMLSGMEDAIRENFFDVMRHTPFDSGQRIQGSAFYAASLRTDVPTMAAIPFSTQAMGLW